MNASLVLIRTDGTQKEVPLKRGSVVVGRENDADIRIPVSGVSRQHCQFEVGEGGVRVSDLGSRNGTFVNGEKITKQDLAAGDTIAVDQVVFVLRIDGQPAEVDATARNRALPSSLGGMADEKDDLGLTPAKRGAGGDMNDSSVEGFDFDDLLDDEDDAPKL